MATTAQTVAANTYAGYMSNPTIGAQPLTDAHTAELVLAAVADATALIALDAGDASDGLSYAALQGFRSNPYFNGKTSSEVAALSRAVGDAVFAFSNPADAVYQQAAVLGVISNPVANNDVIGMGAVIDNISTIMAANIP